MTLRAFILAVAAITFATGPTMPPTTKEEWACESQSKPKTRISFRVHEPGDGGDYKAESTLLKNAKGFREVGLVKLWNITEYHVFIIMPDNHGVYAVTPHWDLAFGHDFWQEMTTIAKFNCRRMK